MALLSIKDFMTAPVITADPDDPVEGLVKVMDKHNIGSIVIKKGGKVLGIVTERDVMRRACAKDKSIAGTPAKDIMTKDVVTLPPEATIVELSNTMHKHYFRHVLIVAKGRLMG